MQPSRRSGPGPRDRRPYPYTAAAAAGPPPFAPPVAQSPAVPQPFLSAGGPIPMAFGVNLFTPPHPQPPQNQPQNQMRFWPMDQSQQQAPPPAAFKSVDLEISEILDSGGPPDVGPPPVPADAFAFAPTVTQPSPQPQSSASRPRPARPRKPSASAGMAVSASSAGMTSVSGSVSAVSVSAVSDEPDLSQRKLDEKNEKCQYAGCPNRARVEQVYGKFCNRHVIVAPCGFPGCRERAMARASMCERHALEGKDALHQILNARAQNVPVCRTFGCFKNDQGRGYCRGHEKLLMATGRLPKHINRRRVNNAYTMCSYPGCAKHSQRNHLCRTHGNLVMKQAEELAARGGSSESYDEILLRLQKDIRRCSHPSCTKNSQRDRLCTMHYYEKHNIPRDGKAGQALAQAQQQHPEQQLQGPGAVQAATVVVGDAENRPGVGNAVAEATAIRDVERTRCVASGCSNASFVGGLCALHGKQPPLSLSSSSIQAQDPQLQPRADVPVVRVSVTFPGATSPVSLGSNPSSPSEANGGIDNGGNGSAACRVHGCGMPAELAGLCATHLRAFEAGALPIDRVTLASNVLHEQKLQAAAAASAEAEAEAEAARALASANANAVSSNASGAAPARKYFCRVDGCGRQAQKRGLCKRHFREQEGTTVSASQRQEQA